VLKRLLGKSQFSDQGLALYRAAVEQARQPHFYLGLAVPDSVDGRFDLIALHIFLVMRRLKREGEVAKALSQDLSEIFFADMDINLRELGASDIGVGRRVKRMIEGFYGRALAYEAALDGAGENLAEVLRRNLYGTIEVEEATLLRVAVYVEAVDQALAQQPWSVLEAGKIAFPSPQKGAEENV